jgi:hypothetical protein
VSKYIGKYIKTLLKKTPEERFKEMMCGSWELTCEMKSDNGAYHCTGNAAHAVTFDNDRRPVLFCRQCYKSFVAGVFNKRYGARVLSEEQLFSHNGQSPADVK